MLTVILFALASLVIGRKAFMDGWFGIFERFMAVVVCMIIGILIACAIGTMHLPSVYVQDKEIELVVLRDTYGVEGDFFLGSGNVQSEFYYVFYKKEKDGSVRFDKLSTCYKVSVWEEERQDGKLVISRKRFKSKIANLFAIFDVPKYDIFIPKNSILRNFQLDLK